MNHSPSIPELTEQVLSHLQNVMLSESASSDQQELATALFSMITILRLRGLL